MKKISNASSHDQGHSGVRSLSQQMWTCADCQFPNIHLEAHYSGNSGWFWAAFEIQYLKKKKKKLILHDHWGNMLVRFFQQLTFKCPITKFYHFQLLFFLPLPSQEGENSEAKSKAGPEIAIWLEITSTKSLNPNTMNECPRATLKSIVQIVKPKFDFIKFLGRRLITLLGRHGAAWPLRFSLYMNILISK